MDRRRKNKERYLESIYDILELTKPKESLAAQKRIQENASKTIKGYGEPLKIK